MTMRYLEVTPKQILQREFQFAHARTPRPTACPRFLSPSTPAPLERFPPSSRHWRPPIHLLEMHRRCLTDEKARRQFQLLDRRLRAAATADQLALIATAEK